MTKFAVFNDEGFPTAFYWQDDHTPDVPVGAIEITDEQWLEFVDNAGLRRWNGGRVVEYTPPEPTPEELRAQMPPLTPRQFRDALIDHDIMPDDVTAAINQIADVKDRAKALNAWEYPTQFVRTEPLIEQIGAIFSLTPEDIDDMWRQATA